MPSTEISYRESHKAKGEDYQAFFSENLRVALLWQIEQRILRDLVSRFVGDRKVAHLDFACGTGRLLSFLHSMVDSSTGVDISESMLEVAKTNCPDAEFHLGDITRQEIIPDRQFDLITAFRFFPNAEKSLREEVIVALAKRLVPGGYLVFNNHRNHSSLAYALRRMIKLGRGGPQGMTQAEVSALLKLAGLKQVRTYHAGVLPEAQSFLVRPRILATWFEKVASRLPLARFAEDVIYVCRKDQ